MLLILGLRPQFRTLLILVALLALLRSAAWAQPATAAPTPPAGVTAPVVAKVYYTDKADLNAMGAELDVWTVVAREGYAVVLLHPEQYSLLLVNGHRIEVDAALTAQVNAASNDSVSPDAGIPGFTCYRTVEETYDTMAALAANYPNLLTWTDTGDSWEKVTPGGAAGYDLYTMVLTNQATAGPKPKFYLMAAIHAREYATAELSARFVGRLVADYGIDADTTWLIDNYELHAVFQVNPDGRKKAETLGLWRKNTDNDDGCGFDRVDLGYYYGTDLNRNTSFKWNTGGSSANSCSETYHGPTAASEPETQHVENYMAAIFGDHRGSGDADPAPLDAEGLMISLHSYGNSVLYPWGWNDAQQAPNDTQLRTLGRKFGFYNGFEVCQSASCYYIASGGTDDYAYGALGIPGYTFEVGTAFFQDCATFTNDILPRNLPALKYAFKAARRPYQDPAGPEPYSVAMSSGSVTRGASVTLTARADDARSSSGGYGIEPSQNVIAARYTIDTPSWKGGIAWPMMPADGAFDTFAEDLIATIDTTALAPGKHTVFVEAQDATGRWGVPSAAFLTVSGTIFLPLIFANQPALTWSQVNDPGFNEHLPPYPGQEAFDLTVFKDQLYLGMEGRICARIWRSRAGATAPLSQAGWEEVVANGFDGSTDCALTPATTDNDHIDSLEPFAGYIYASTAMQTGDRRGTQVWRSPSGDPGTWTRVNQPGFGQHTNENTKDMIEFAGLLCGGTGNWGGAGIEAGAQVWCTDGGADPDRTGELLWTQRNRNGFGHVENVKIWSSAVYEGALYFGVEADGGDGSIWRTRNIGDPDAWEQVFAPGDVSIDVQVTRIDVLEGFDGALYVGMAVPGQGTYIYRSAGGERYTWTPVVSDGFGSPTSGRLISDASTVMGDALYVAILDEVQGTSVWRTLDGSTWSRMSTYGFGDSATFAAELISFHGGLYAWTSNYATGPGVWHGRASP